MRFDENGYYIPQDPEPMPTLRDDILTTEQLANVPKPTPLISGSVNLNSLAWIAGPPGSYKTFLALDYALTVARTHHVLYVAGEGLGGLYARVEAWHKADGTPPNQRMHWLPYAVPVTTTQWFQLCEVAKELNCALVVLDTQARMSGALDENSASDMGQYINGCEALKRATGGCVLSIHHSSKNGAHLRGSTAVQGAADTIITIEVRNKIVGVHNLKQKDMEQFPDTWYRPTPSGDSCVLVECERPNDWDTKQRRTAYKDNEDA